MATRRTILEAAAAGAVGALTVSWPRGVWAEPSPMAVSTLVKGRYYWKLLFNLDNSTNSKTLQWMQHIRTEQTIDCKEFLKSQFNITADYKYKNETTASLSFDGVTGGAKTNYSVHEDVARELVSISQNTKTTTETKDVTQTYNIGPRSKLSLYQLCYDSDGVSYETDTVSTSPTKAVFVEMRFTCLKRILGLNDVLFLFGHTFPEHDNVGEWNAIRNSVVQYSDKSQEVAFKHFVEMLSTIRPQQENIGEWGDIRATCNELLKSWESESNKTLLFKKLLYRFSVIVPHSANQGEWRAIRQLSNEILSGMAEVWS